MNNSRNSPWARANEAFRNRDYESALRLYQEALELSDEPFKARIRFNIDLALRRLGKEKFSPRDAPKRLDGLEIYTPETVEYIPRLPKDTPTTTKVAKVIAFYLPQFHSIPENDAWWGEGFTDWENVKSSKPLFEGHNQPRIPDDFLGYYDLSKKEVQAKQVELAKQYGVEAFCFYLYWFNGRRLLEKPVENYLNDLSLDLPFCICWANENWTRRWDGLDDDLLIEQKYSSEDDISFISENAKFFRDPRYIRINNKPLLLIYRPSKFPNIKNTVQRWRKWCRENGIGEIYLTYPQSFEQVDPSQYDFDAACEFPPNVSKPPKVSEKLEPTTERFDATVYDWRVFVDRSENYQNPGYKIFRSITPSWDNSPRRKSKAIIFKNNRPKLFEKWLTNAFMNALQNENADERIVFLNAWNEWGEGAFIEPDRQNGYAYLDAIRRAHLNASTIRASEFQGKTVLIVDYALPLYDRFAGSRTNFMYLKILLKMGFRVIYLPADFRNIEPYSTELKALGVEILAGESFKKNWLEWFKKNGMKINFAFLHKPNPSLLFFDALLHHTRAALIYQCHDLHYLRLQRQAALTGDKDTQDEADFFKKKEHYLFSKSDALLTFSSVEKEILQKDFPSKQIYTVPLFFYERLKESVPKFADRENILFVGGFDHTPNRDAVTWFCSEIYPIVLKKLPELVFYVVGANPPAEIKKFSSKNIKVVEKVSDSKLLELYNSVRVSVIPLRAGAGVKGKVIESLYHGVPVVSTSIGLEGISGVSSITTARDMPEDFASDLINIYSDPSAWEYRSSAGCNFVRDNFTDGIAAEKIHTVFNAATVAAKSRLSLQPTRAKEVGRVKLIAFHLPQYHPIAENDEWWGKGFTEWHNVCKAQPRFLGHYQPHLPRDLGFYDLRLEEARVAQADLARSHGIHGFCYYHYWFNGKKLLERPIEEMLAAAKPNFSFCLCWANENWTRRWDGEDSSVLIEQVYSESDDRSHINYLFQFFSDPRYIRVEGKPLFLVYRTENMPNPLRTAEIWREEAIKAGIGELYLARVESIGRINPHQIGFDAAVEFAPDWERLGEVARSHQPSEPQFPDIVEIPPEIYEANYVRDYAQLSENMRRKERPAYPWYRCVTPSWDNTARRKDNAVILVNSSPERYQEWLEWAIRDSTGEGTAGERIVFINAWNEWAEGNHLEPCAKWGRKYLEATRIALNAIQMSSGIAANDPSSETFTAESLGTELDPAAAASMQVRIETAESPGSLIISFEEHSDAGNKTYLRGWAAVNDESSTEGTEVAFLVKGGDATPRLFKPAKRKRPEITSHFQNKRNLDHSGFELMVDRVDSKAQWFVVIKRGDTLFWQQHKI